MERILGNVTTVGGLRWTDSDGALHARTNLFVTYIKYILENNEQENNSVYR